MMNKKNLLIFSVAFFLGCAAAPKRGPAPGASYDPASVAIPAARPTDETIRQDCLNNPTFVDKAELRPFCANTPTELLTDGDFLDCVNDCMSDLEPLSVCASECAR